ncbi:MULTISPECIES: hypothetical protein [unclassified Leeuwenhoekiella]|uniref:hypothetical protein n=1 Tax=unclassified Leeuwenhoekiella TaxID=2615029 RepID=UPI000C5C6B5A|nr:MULTISPECIES: hypothetical protein [unclassified Leeuwenhoekiella]MBA82511.1 hypothetical protein [Leeuwenhoekiella sp.]
MNLSSAKYRITYEAFSKFSYNLNTVETFEDLGKVTNKHLKYLFNFKMFRILLVAEQPVICYTFSKSLGVNISFFETILPYEEELLIHKTPGVLPLQPDNLPEYLSEKFQTLENGKLWMWYTTLANYKVCFSIVSDDSSPFSHNDIEILNLLVDNIVSRYVQIQLTEELKNKNIKLKEAISEIELKNKEIEEINNNQQNIILKRTEELRFKNQKLLELSKLNAHNLREPLSRIMGFLEIADLFNDVELRNEIFPKIKISTHQLDQVFREVVAQSENVAANYNITENKHD